MNNININIRSHVKPKIGDKVNKKQARKREELFPPKNRGFVNIPNADILQKLVDRAIEAMKQGIYWDRGSIINITI